MIDITRYKHHIGKCLASDLERKYWINIPKNASNSISFHLLRQKQWRDSNWLTDTKIIDYHGVVVLRDPISRWQGSTLELCYHYLERSHWSTENFNEWFKKRNFFEFDRNLDLHHVRQIDFLHSLELDTLKFVYMNCEFETSICKSLDISPPLKKINISSENAYKKLVKSHVEELLENHELVEKIREFYQDDYDLIKMINPC